MCALRGECLDSIVGSDHFGRYLGGLKAGELFEAGEGEEGMSLMHVIGKRGDAKGMVEVLGLVKEGGGGGDTVCGKKGWTALMYLIQGFKGDAGGEILPALVKLKALGGKVGCADKHGRSVVTIAKRNKGRIGEEADTFLETWKGEEEGGGGLPGMIGD